MDLTNIYAIATVISVIVLALTELVKRTFNLQPRFIPLAALLLGMAVGIAAAPLYNVSIPILLWGGGIAGLMASGVFEHAKKVLKKKEDDKDEDNSN